MICSPSVVFGHAVLAVDLVLLLANMNSMTTNTISEPCAAM